MFITKIKIKNFKGIKSIDIDLYVNKNGIEKDVKFNRFKLLDQKHPITGITALVGRNSVGKSTIINALSFVSDVETGLINKEIINNFIGEEIQILQSKTFFRNRSLDENIFLEFNKIASQKSLDISKDISNKKGLIFQKYIVKSTEWFFNFFENCNNGDENNPIVFEITFLGKSNKKGEYVISLNNEGNISRQTKGDFKTKDYQNYFNNVFAPNRIYDFQKQFPGDLNKILAHSSYHDPNNPKAIEFALENMIFWIGEETTTQILKLCDEDVSGIKHSLNKNISRVQIKNIVVKNKLIQPEDLSSGTKQFVVLVEAIVRAFKNKKNYGLLLFDEIEINLHNELIQSLLHMLTSLFSDFNIQSILTTHNLKSLKPLLSNKQILSIEKNDQKHTIVKASKIMKSHESITTKQDQELFAYYPDKELIRNTIADFIYELKKK